MKTEKLFAFRRSPSVWQKHGEPVWGRRAYEMAEGDFTNYEYQATARRICDEVASPYHY